jgi:nitrite reductase/ring-hydroxylating ferredoxin subunit
VVWHPLIKHDALSDGEVTGVDLAGDRRVAVYRLGDEYFVTDDICTHQKAHLSEGYVEDGCIHCPLHFGSFDIRTGQPTGPPVTKPLAVLPVRIEDGVVLADLAT